MSLLGTVPDQRAIIQVEQLSQILITRLNKTIILDNVTYYVPQGSLFAITGPSGSGKSTLLNMMTGIDRPSSGRILFAGQELRTMRENALARWRGRHVGIVFQFFQLIPTLTALENVLLALELGGGGGEKRAKLLDRALPAPGMVHESTFASRPPREPS